MTTKAGDQAKVSILVKVPPEVAFRVFTEEIDQWWRHGRRYRVGDARRDGRAAGSTIHLEPKVDGRLFESFEATSARSAAHTSSSAALVETGKVLVWEPPSRLVFEWRAVNFAPAEHTEVEVAFAPSPSGTLVTVTHRGWGAIRLDHPARHGLDVPSFVRMLGMWWSDLMTSMREHASPHRE